MDNVLVETFSDDEIIVSELDEDALNKHINSNDRSNISEIIQDTLTDMGIDHFRFSWSISVTIEQEK